MVGQDVQDFETFLLATVFDAMAEHNFLSRVMHALIKAEFPPFPGRLERPAGENPRYLGHIFLGITAVHTQGVKLHQLAAVVFVQPDPLAGLSWRRGPPAVRPRRG